jgi:NAD(P)-dependent dehydrogenase (short-subunit alcohol dehydrogenase family)
MSLSETTANSGRVAGKVALITGAASGIGLATAVRLAEEGAKIVLTDINEIEGRQATANLTDAGHDAIFSPLNVVDPKSWESVIALTLETWGRLDILLNSAGIGRVYPLLETTLEQWRETIAINLDGTFLGTQAGVRAMKESGGGSIINISSVLGLVGGPTFSAYSASKGGVRMFTKAVALECAALKLNIRINSVHPGYIETPMVTRGYKNFEDDGATFNALKNKHPIGRLGQSNEVANMILYLASDESTFVTAAEFVIDGGYTAQ